METIAIVDTSICTDNIGDEIIMDAVNTVVESLFPSAYIFRVPSHEALSDRTKRFLKSASVAFIGGTNLLSSNLTPRGLWRLDADAAEALRQARTVSLGCGWNDYMPEPTAQTRELLRCALSPHFQHAVRDTYTQAHLAKIGLNAVSTSCPTTWLLDEVHCSKISVSRADEVVLTLSAWRPDAAADAALVDALFRHYKKVHFFPQMQGDWAYFCSLNPKEVNVISPRLNAYDKFLEQTDVDFIGTRLHGGIRALQKHRRALILAIDNRATEIGKDIGLPVLPRDATAEIESWIENPTPTRIRLPQATIDGWKAQFTSEALAAAPIPSSPPKPRFRRRLKRVAQRALGMR